jgi:hypothetical protein
MVKCQVYNDDDMNGAQKTQQNLTCYLKQDAEFRVGRMWREHKGFRKWQRYWETRATQSTITLNC